ncbi:MAG: glycosyltransferase family 2 protein [bacterium]|nr:glycosyltransferase family 2 protein [bacterium]
MSSPLVTINLVVFNGEKYLRHCLNAVKKQTYPNIEVNILNNASTDQTAEIIHEFASLNTKYKILNTKSNLGTWPGQEKALEYSQGEYILALSVDVLLHPEFVTEAVKVMQNDEKIGAVQSKTYQYTLNPILNTEYDILHTNLIDTAGFRLLRNRRLINVGHGEEDQGQYEKEEEIFGVEGAAPFFRRSALEDCRVQGKIIDKDMFWYGDDLDLAWRMHLYGWKQVYSPQVIAYHDRSTTKGMSKGWIDYLSRIKIRRQIPIKKRRWDWRNKRIARLKNDYWHNVFHDLPFILHREFMEFVYIVLVEPAVLLEMLKFITLIPKTLRKRKAVFERVRVSPEAMRKWFMAHGTNKF